MDVESKIIKIIADHVVNRETNVGHIKLDDIDADSLDAVELMSFAAVGVDPLTNTKLGNALEKAFKVHLNLKKLDPDKVTCIYDLMDHINDCIYANILEYVSKTVAEWLAVDEDEIESDTNIRCPFGIFMDDGAVYSLQSDLEIHYGIGFPLCYFNDVEDVASISSYIQDELEY